jgi:hypothetical protein
MSKDTKFKPGESGNPNGRPEGATDKRTTYRELLKPHAEALINKAVNLALEGDTTCLRICIDRLVSPYRPSEKAISISDFAGTLSEKGEKVIQSIATGDISPGDGASVLSALASQARITETDEFEKRLSALEKRL